MKRTIRRALLAVSIGATLAGCGGSGGGGGSATGAAGGTELPASAMQSVEALMAWANDQIAHQTNSASEPVAIGQATLPTSDTREPF